MYKQNDLSLSPPAEEFNPEGHIWMSLCQSLKPYYYPLYYEHMRAHPEFYIKFEADTLALIKEGETRASARRVAQDIRWDHRAKFSDPVIAYYARLFISKWPQYRHVFTLKGISRRNIDKVCLKK